MEHYIIKISNKERLILILDWLYNTYKTTTNAGKYTKRLSEYSSLIDNCENSGLKVTKNFTDCQSWSRNNSTHTDKAFIKEFIDKPKFEVGKWYKFNYDYCKKNHTIYGKCKGSKGDEFYCIDDWYINSDKGISNDCHHIVLTHDNIKITLLTDLSEIQQYLPDEHLNKIINKMTNEFLLEYANTHFVLGTKFISHISDVGNERECSYYDNRNEPFNWQIVIREGIKTVYCHGGMYRKSIDNKYICSNPTIYTEKDGWCKITHDASIKTSSELTLNNLVAGEIYYLEYTCCNSNYILKSTGGNKSDYNIRIHDQKYDYYKDNSYNNDNSKVRIATQQEKDWLEACIKDDKFIPRENFKSDEFVLPEKWYVKEDPGQIISKHFKKNGYYVCYSNLGVGYDSIPDFHTEITFEQFKKYVLKSTPMQTNFDNCKIWIGDNPKLNEQVQKRIFELGYKWREEDDIVKYTDSTGLYLDEDKTLSYSTGTRLNYFDSQSNKEISLKNLGIINKKDENRIPGSYRGGINSICVNTSVLISKIEPVKGIIKEIKDYSIK